MVRDVASSGADVPHPRQSKGAGAKRRLYKRPFTSHFLAPFPVLSSHFRDLW